MAVRDIIHNQRPRLPREWRATRSQQPWLPMHACNAEQRDWITSPNRPRNGSQVCKLGTYVLCPMSQPRNFPWLNTRLPHCISNVTRNPQCCPPPPPAFHSFSGRARTRSHYITTQCPVTHKSRPITPSLARASDQGAPLSPH